MFTAVLIAAFSCGADPQPKFTGVNKMPAFTGINKLPAAEPAPTREFWGGSWGWMERGPDGIYRQVSQAAPAVAATGTFPYHAGHKCPNGACRSSQFTVAGFNRDGTHNHVCASCGTGWRH